MPDPITKTWHNGFHSDSASPQAWQINSGLLWEVNASRNQLKIAFEGQPHYSVTLENDFRPLKIDEIRGGKAYRVFGQIREKQQSFTLLHGQQQLWYGVGKGLCVGPLGRVNNLLNERNANKIER